MSLAFTNEWYIFNGEVDKQTCNKIKKLAQGNWEESSVRLLQSETTDEERRTGKKG